MAGEGTFSGLKPLEKITTTTIKHAAKKRIIIWLRLLVMRVFLNAIQYLRKQFVMPFLLQLLIQGKDYIAFI